MKIIIKPLIFALIIIVLVGAIIVVNSFSTNHDFYVGVTYCGDNVEDAKMLIDKVNDYTNLFVLQSGSLQNNASQIEEIGDYAVASGLKYMVYQGIGCLALANNWLSTYDGHWGSNFLGVYAIDEPGGKMLDGDTMLYHEASDSWIQKKADGSISGYKLDSTTAVRYMRNGTIHVEKWDGTIPYNYVVYYPNGTIAGASLDFEQSGIRTTLTVITDTSLLNYTYQELWAAHPIKTADVAKELYLNWTSREINDARRDQNGTLNVITADYGLHWYDYQSGYDVVLTNFGWNQSITQSIAVVRGAANIFNKDWGAIITWKYTQAPYLASGDEIYGQMCAAYENGAKYVVIFNYAESMHSQCGILQNEHFIALQHFWDDIQNQNIKHGAVKADTAFMLPNSYGSGLRRQGDVIWGLWEATDDDDQILRRMQDALAKYGEKLDIVYEDSANPTTSKYSQIIYWNQTT